MFYRLIFCTYLSLTMIVNASDGTTIKEEMFPQVKMSASDPQLPHDENALSDNLDQVAAPVPPSTTPWIQTIKKTIDDFSQTDEEMEQTTDIVWMMYHAGNCTLF